MNKRLSIPIVLGLMLLHIKLVRDREKVPFQYIELSQIYRDPDAIQGLAFSSDSQSLAIAERGGFLQIWSIQKSKFESRFSYPRVGDALIWRNDNHLIAGGYSSFYSVVLNGQNLRPETSRGWKKHNFPPHSPRHEQCVISSTGNLAAVGEMFGAVSVWNIEKDKRISSFKSARSVTCGLAFSADENTLAVANIVFSIDPNTKATKTTYPERIGKEIALHNAQTGALQKILPWNSADITPFADDYTGNMGGLNVAFSPNGRIIAGVSEAGLSVWKVSNGQFLYKRENENVPRSGDDKQITFSPDSSLIAAAGLGKKICVWSSDTERVLQEFDDVDVSQSLKFSPDGQWLASGGMNYGGKAVVKIWDVSNMN